jgi:predicted nucleic acid-binding protein
MPGSLISPCRGLSQFAYAGIEHIISPKISFMLLVLDTDVVVSAMRSPSGASAELLRLARIGSFSLGVTVALALEYEAVCLRDEHIQASGLRFEEAQNFVDAVIAMARPISVHYRWRPQLRDPADEMVLEAAVNAGANALLTFNIRHFSAASAAFKLKLSKPGEFLRSLS